MKNYNNTKPRTGNVFIIVVSIIVTALGLLTFLGWILHIPTLTSFNSSLIPMAPSTAILFVLFGVMLFLSGFFSENRLINIVNKIFNLLGGAAAVLLFFFSWKGIQLQIEHFGIPISGTVNNVPIGHMSPITAVCFVLVSLSFFFVHSFLTRYPKRKVLIFMFPFILSLISFILLLAYFYGTPIAYEGEIIPPALPTSLAFFILAIGLLIVTGKEILSYDKMKNREFLHTTYILTLVFIFLVFGIVTMGYLYYRNYEKQFRAEVEQHLSAISELRVNQLVQWRKDRIGDGEFLFKNNMFSSLVKRYIENSKDLVTKRKIQTWMWQVRKVDDYDLVMLLDTMFTKMILIPEKKERVHSFVDESNAAILRSGNIAFQDFYFNEQNQKIYLKILVPIIDEHSGSSLIGIVALRIDPEKYLYPLIKKWPTTSKTSETLIVRREGNKVLLLNELRFQKNTALKLHTSISETDIPDVKAVLGQEGIIEGKEYHGIPVIACLKHIPDTPWFLVVRMDKAEVYKPVKERLRIMIILVCTLLFGSGTCVGFVWHQQRTKFYKSKLESAERISRLNRIYAVLSYINQAIVHIREPQALFDKVCQIAVEQGKFAFTWIGILDDSTKSLRPVASAGKFDDYYKNINILLKKEPIIYCPIDRALRNGRHFICNLSQQENSLASCQRKALELGYLSSVTIPLIVSANIKGTISFYSNEPDFFTENECKLLNGLATDISFAIEFAENESTRRQLDDLAHKSEERLKEAQRLAQVGNWELDLQTNKLTWSDEIYQIFEINPIEFGSSYEAFLDAIHPDDREFVNKIYLDSVKNKTPYKIDHRLLMKSGSIKFVQERCKTFYDDRGNPVRSVGTVQDITERKRAEEALKVSEERFRSLYENSSIGIYRTTPDGRILLANPKLIKLLGYSTFEELAARDLTKCGYEPSYTRSKFLEMVEKEGEIKELESCWITKDGVKIYLREGARAIRDLKGKTLYYDGIVEDITERKRAENNEKLAYEVLEHLNRNEDSEVMIDEIIKSIKKSTEFDAIGIRIKEDEDFPYYGTIGLNESFIEKGRFLCSYDREGKLILDNEGKPLLECMCGNILSGKIDYAKSFFTKGGSFSSSSTTQMLATISDLDPMVKRRNQCTEAGYESVALIPIKSGKEVIGLMQLNDHRKNMFAEEMMPFFEGLGASIGLALKRNQVIKEILKLNEELELRVAKRTSQLEAANKELEAFSYSVSHDLRAPLRAIAGFSKILVEDFSSLLDAEAQRLLNVIVDNTKNMGELIDDLLAFSRLNRQEIKMSRIDMKGMAKSIYYELAPVPERGKIKFSVLSIPDAFGDPSMLRQVWRNLISNAIKFSSTKEKPEIEIGKVKSKTENIYYIKDNGVGFNMDYAQKLFGVFQRLHSSKDFEGTGVGLANVQRIINRHGGRVWAEGKVDEGAVFYFSLNNNGA